MFLTKAQRRRRRLGRILFYIGVSAISYAAPAVFALFMWLCNQI